MATSSSTRPGVPYETFDFAATVTANLLPTLARRPRYRYLRQVAASSDCLAGIGSIPYLSQVENNI